MKISRTLGIASITLASLALTLGTLQSASAASLNTTTTSSAQTSRIVRALSDPTEGEAGSEDSGSTYSYAGIEPPDTPPTFTHHNPTSGANEQVQWPRNSLIDVKMDPAVMNGNASRVSTVWSGIRMTQTPAQVTFRDWSVDTNRTVEVDVIMVSKTHMLTFPKATATTVGYTTTRYGSDHFIDSCVIRLRQDVADNTTAWPTARLKHLVMHETGHCMGLDHPSTAPKNQKLIMYPNIGSGNAVLSDFHAKEKALMSPIYP